MKLQMTPEAAMDREELMEEFMIAYQDTLMEIGLDNREIARMAYGRNQRLYFSN